MNNVHASSREVSRQEKPSEEFVTPSLGATFKKARVERGFSLEDVAEELKIRKFFLRSIEDERYELLPGGVYTIGFVKSYAKYLGLDQEAAVERLKGLDFSNLIRLNAVGDERDFPPARRVSVTMIVLGLVIFLVCSACAYFFSRTDRATMPLTDDFVAKTTTETVAEAAPALALAPVPEPAPEIL